MRDNRLFLSLGLNKDVSLGISSILNFAFDNPPLTYVDSWSQV
jgi:hypothetical protein